MPRLKNITTQEIEDLEERGFEVSQIATDLHSRASQGYADEIPQPMRRAVAFLSVASAFTDLARHLLMKAQLEEQKRELDAMIRKRSEQ